MKATEIMSAIKAQRDKIIDVMIKAMMERDIETTRCWTEITYDLNTGESTSHYYSGSAPRMTVDDAEISILTLCPVSVPWYHECSSIGEMADMIGVDKEDLIAAARSWLEIERWIDEDDPDSSITYDMIGTWIEHNEDLEIVTKLHAAVETWIREDCMCEYEDEAERRYDGLIREWSDHMVEEYEAAAYEAAVLRGEV